MKFFRRKKRSKDLEQRDILKNKNFMPYLVRDGELSTNAREEKLKRQPFRQFFSRIHRQGSKYLTIMFVPHTEKKVRTWHMSIYGLAFLSCLFCVILFASVVWLVDRSGKGIQFYDIGLGNHQFALQTIRIAEVAVPLHELVRKYVVTIAELSAKLDSDSRGIESLKPLVDATLKKEVKELNEIVAKCRSSSGPEQSCSQEEIEEILRKSIYLSQQDNLSIKQAIKLSKKIFSALNTKEKQYLFENTPSIWPTKGYLLSPYGLQIDPLRGYQSFLRGIRIGALFGTEVVATAPGEITSVSFNREYGLHLRIQHSYGISSFYAHLNQSYVKKGDQVDKGEIIGQVGKSGNAPLPMLYYEVHVGTVAYNPHAFLNHLRDLWQL